MVQGFQVSVYGVEFGQFVGEVFFYDFDYFGSKEGKGQYYLVKDGKELVLLVLFGVEKVFFKCGYCV